MGPLTYYLFLLKDMVFKSDMHCNVVLCLDLHIYSEI